MFCLRSLVALAVLHRLQTLLPAGARSEVEKWYSLEMHDPIQDVTPGPQHVSFTTHYYPQSIQF